MNVTFFHFQISNHRFKSEIQDLAIFHNYPCVSVYRVTRRFPDDERFGLTSQLRRAALSIASNIVEGAARNSLTEYLRFLDMSYGSAKEVEYQVSIAQRLGYAEPQVLDELANQASETAKVLNGLVRGLRNKT